MFISSFSMVLDSLMFEMEIDSSRYNDLELFSS